MEMAFVYGMCLASLAGLGWCGYNFTAELWWRKPGTGMEREDEDPEFPRIYQERKQARSA